MVTHQYPLAGKQIASTLNLHNHIPMNAYNEGSTTDMGEVSNV